MKETETKKVLAMVQELWPTFGNGRNLEVTAGLWQRLFADDAYVDVSAAVFAYASNDEKGYPPPIGALKTYIHRIHDDSPNEQEAWQIVRKAIGNGSYHSNEEFDNLPEPIKRCVPGPQFLRDCADMDVCQIDTVVASQFMKTYRAEKAKAAEMQKMPVALQKMFDKPKAAALPDEPIRAKLPPKGTPSEKEKNAVPCPPEIKAKLRMLWEAEET